jgi:hypothetical protein
MRNSAEIRPPFSKLDKIRSGIDECRIPGCAEAAQRPEWKYWPTAVACYLNDLGWQIIVGGIEQSESGRTLSKTAVRAKRFQKLHGIDHAFSKKSAAIDPGTDRSRLIGLKVINWRNYGGKRKR